MSLPSIRWLFLLAALYDGVLGLLFLAAPEWPFTRFEITPPNHFSYVQFPAALLLIFTLMFLRIARDPVGNRPLIVYGILLKVSYCGIAFAYWALRNIPWIWKPFAVADAVMLVLFWLAWQSVGRQQHTAHQA